MMVHAIRSDPCSLQHCCPLSFRSSLCSPSFLLQAVQEAGVLRQQVESAERDRAALAAAKARLAAAERQARATEWELEVTQQLLQRVGGWPGWLAGWRAEVAGGWL